MAKLLAPKTISVSFFILAFWMFVLMATPTNAFIRHLCFNPLGFARVDPIMSPNLPSQHLHHLHGSSNLGLSSLDAQDFLDGNCTSCSITADRSGYWTPAMYFQHDNGTFELLTTASAITVYYKLEKRVNFEDQNYTVFPQGFRMVAGSSPKRTWDGPWPVPPQSFWGPNDTTQAALAEKSLGFNCMNYVSGHDEPSFGYPWLRNKSFIDNQCIDGVRAEVLFPSCWDGVNLDMPDHKSHVAYPTLLQDGACPDTHPVFLPILFYETIWNTQHFKDVPGQFVMSNGDPTGFGYHGDFFAAWQEGVLQQIAEDPTCTDHNLTARVSSGQQQVCAAINGTLQSPEIAAQCHLETPEVLEKDPIFGFVDALPGGMNITGKRYDPGTPIPLGSDPIVSSSVDASGSVSTSSTAATSESAKLTSIIATASPSSSSTVVASNPNSTLVPSILSASDSSSDLTASITSQVATTPSSAAINIMTSTYISDGVYVELVIVETTVTTTVEVTVQPTIIARHGHAHGRKHGVHK